MNKTVRDLKPGQSGKVRGIRGKGPTKRRLMDMGITGGTNVYVEKIAPLGDPIEVRIRGYNLTFRKADAESIVID